MSQSYCQKDCGLCPELESCGGCHSGPYAGQCPIAKCCREKGHPDCGGCSYLPTCVTNRASSRMPEELLARKRREEAVRQGQKQRVSRMAVWLPLIFWALITNTVVDLLLSLVDVFVDTPILAILDATVSAVVMLAVAWGYWKLREADEGFHFVAVFHCVSAAFSIAELFLPEEGILTLIVGVLVAIMGVVSIRSECMAYRDALSGVNQDLSEKWENQWTHTTYAILGLIASLLLVLIPLVGMLVMLGCLVFIIFLLIREMVYLYQTMEFCQGYAQS